MQITDALKQATQQLLKSDSTRLDAEVLLCSVLHCERSYLYSHSEQNLYEDHMEKFFKMVSLRATGHPVAHLTGNKEFWSMNFMITPNMLIPRPETETLVEAALPFIPKNESFSILDLGTGCGAIAIALALERPQSKITATDIDKDVLLVAIKNANLHRVKNVRFQHGDWFCINALNSFDLIVSNPPYICEGNPHLEQGDVRFEPRIALVSGKEGLDDIKRIITNVKNHLNLNGWLFIEHGYEQGEVVRKVFAENRFENIETKNDYGNRERVTLGKLTKRHKERSMQNRRCNPSNPLGQTKKTKNQTTR